VSANRPLILIFFSLAAGILSIQWIAPDPHLFIAGAAAALICFTVAVFLSGRLPPALILAVFFLLGGMLDATSHRDSVVAPYARARTLLTVDGTVLEPARTEDGVGKLTVRTSFLLHQGHAIPTSEVLAVTIYGNVPQLSPGDRIRFPARLRPFTNFKNPGRYDYEQAMKMKGLSCSASVSDGRYVVPMGKGNLNFLEGFVQSLKRPVREFLAKNLAEDRLPLLMALVLGERHDISNNIRDHFSRTGLSHALAVSGLHVGMVAWAAFFALKWLMLRSYRLALAVDVQKWSAFFTFFPVTAYALLAGFQVSAQRALVMVAVFLFSLIVGRSRDIWSTLSLAGILVLVLDPHAIFSISFQLSFGAVTGILLLGPVLMGLASKKKLPRIIVYLWGIASATISATVFLLPVTSFYFNQVSLVSIPANLIAVPILGVLVLPMGLLSVFLLPLSHALSLLALKVSAFGAEMMLLVIRFFSGFDRAVVWVATPNIAEIIIFLGILILIPIVKIKTWARPAIMVLLISLALDTGYWIYRLHGTDNLRITYLDVAQGNAALLEMPGGKRMLIDGGGFARDTFDVGRFVVAPFLWSQKIRTVDYLVLSHPQADHMNGLRFIAKTFSPREFWHSGAEISTPSFQELISIIKEEGIREVRLPELRDTKEMKGVVFEILHPSENTPIPGASDLRANLNDCSLVIRCSFSGNSFLFPGDIEEASERHLVETKGVNLASDVLLVPHHGSRTSSTSEFLARVKPRLCVISSGREGLFGFPHRETISRLEAVGARILRTDRDGAVQVVSLPGLIEVKTFSGLRETIRK